MALHTSLPVWLAVFGAVMMTWPNVTPLRCYNCENEESNTMCTTDTNLLQCENGMDTCQTIVSMSDVSEKLAIIKGCTKNVSCDLQINATRDLIPCDQSQSSWICTSCCYDDACNVDTASESHTTVLFVFITALSVIMTNMYIH